LRVACFVQDHRIICCVRIRFLHQATHPLLSLPPLTTHPLTNSPTHQLTHSPTPLSPTPSSLPASTILLWACSQVGKCRLSRLALVTRSPFRRLLPLVQFKPARTYRAGSLPQNFPITLRASCTSSSSSKPARLNNPCLNANRGLLAERGRDSNGQQGCAS